MENALAQKNPDVLSFENQSALVEKALIVGDLTNLKPADRANYYTSICASLGLNQLTRPFDYILQKGVLKLYARKDCTDQLRFIHKVNISIVDRKILDGLCIVTAKAALPNGRTDESIGAVSTIGLKGEDYANALMKAETKAKRRVTLSICGLGMFDESETASIPDTKPVKINFDTHEILDQVSNGSAEHVNELLSGKKKEEVIECDETTGEVIEGNGINEVSQENTQRGCVTSDDSRQKNQNVVTTNLATPFQLEVLKDNWQIVFVDDNKAANEWAKGMLGRIFNPKNITEAECTRLNDDLENMIRNMPSDDDVPEYTVEDE